MKSVIFFICILSLHVISSFGQTQNYQRAKIFYQNYNDLDRMAKAGIALDHVKSKKNVYLESDFSDFEINAARALGLDVEIIIPNVSHYYAQRNKGKIQDIEKSANRNALCSADSGSISFAVPENYDVKNSSDFGGFYTYSEMLQELDDMHSLYPNLISSRVDLYNPSTPNAYQTEEGRYLQWVKISDNPNTEEGEPQILFDAIHHAREPASLQQLIFFMWYLLENYSSDNEIKNLIDNTEIFFIPCVNPDGYIYNETTDPAGGGMWRKNRKGGYGVDNNRNYSYITPAGNEVWNTTGTSDNTLNDTYAGTGPFSEPENRALRYFIETHNIKMALNAHTYGNLLLFPYGYDFDVPTPDNALFEEISSIMVAQNDYDNKIASELYPAAGDSDDFMYGMLQTENGGTREKVFALTPEIGSSFWPNSSDIIGICQDMADTNINAIRLIHNYAEVADQSDINLPNQNTSISYNLKRLGLSDDGDFTVYIFPLSTNILSVGNSDTFSNMAQGETVAGEIELNLSSDISPGDLIEFDLVVDNGLFESRRKISKVYGTSSTIFSEPANNTSTNWESTAWGTTTADFVSASSSITDSANGDYTANTSSSIQLSNPINLTTGTLFAEVSFMAKWDIESGYDYVQFEVSNDGGNTWIPQCGRYTKTGVADQSGALGEPIYDGAQPNWVKESISLNDYIGDEIWFRFTLHSDAEVQADGFYFDDLNVSVIDPSLGNHTFDVGDIRLYPNPTTNKLYVQTKLDQYHIQITNLLGKAVYRSTALSGNFEASLESLANGLYIISIQHGERELRFKIIKK